MLLQVSAAGGFLISPAKQPIVFMTQTAIQKQPFSSWDYLAADGI